MINKINVFSQCKSAKSNRLLTFSQIKGIIGFYADSLFVQTNFKIVFFKCENFIYLNAVEIQYVRKIVIYNTRNPPNSSVAPATRTNTRLRLRNSSLNCLALVSKRISLKCIKSYHYVFTTSSY